MKRNTQRGFTLIELLVVIAIIGLLSSVVLASLNGARIKGRDARRLADVQQIQVALELYYGSQTSPSYPVYSSAQGTAATVLAALVTGGYMPAIPDDPLGGTYHYVYRSNAAGSYYCIGAIIEGTAPANALKCNATTLGAALTGVQFSVSP